MVERIVFIECDYYQYRLNLAVENKWVGSCAVRAVAYKHLRSMQALRTLRARQSRRLPTWVNSGITACRNFWRFGAPLHHVVIEHGGWHFTSVGTPERIVAKIDSYAHQERNTPAFNSIANISALHESRMSICGRRLRRVPLEVMPTCVRNNPIRWTHLLEAE